MDTTTILEELKERARHDQGLRRRLLSTREDKNPLEAFCFISREAGFELYPMEVVAAGEEFYAAMRRSTNGGGENSPKLAGEDDFYELFLAAL